MFEKAPWFPVVFIAVGCADPAPSGGLTSTLELTSRPGRAPVFLAVQDGDGDWTEVTGTGEPIALTDDHYGIVTVCPDYQPLISSFRALHSELDRVDVSCWSSTVEHTLSGQIDGAVDNGYGCVVGLGRQNRHGNCESIKQTVGSGVYDVVVWQVDVMLVGVASDVRSDEPFSIDLRQGAQTIVLDVPLDDSEAAVGLWTANGTQAWMPRALNDSTVRVLDPAALRDGDANSLTRWSFDRQRQATTTFVGTEPPDLGVPDPLPTPEIVFQTVPSGPRVGTVVHPASDALFYELSSQGWIDYEIPRYRDVATAGWLTTVSNQLVRPELSELPGWQEEWNSRSGYLDWHFGVHGGDTPLASALAAAFDPTPPPLPLATTYTTRSFEGTSSEEPGGQQ